MMPATRAACSGSPWRTPPARTSRRASRDIATDPRATASRAVVALPPTSTMRTRPCASACERRARPAFPAPPSRLLTDVSLRQEEREALERHRQIDALQLHIVGHLQRAGRKVQDRFDARRDHQVDDVLGGGGGHGDDADADGVAPRDLLQIVDVVDRHAAARPLAHLRAQVVEERDDLEAFLAKARVIGQREPEVAGAHDRDAQLAIEAEDLPQVALEIAHVIAHAADAELAEVGEVFSDLRGVEMELLGERLRGNRLDAGVLEGVEAPQ